MSSSSIRHPTEGDKMEETFEKEIPPTEVKAPDDDQGGIGRRLRDRDMLRKRKAEAEEKETNQVQSRKRSRKEPSSTPGKRGRPRKNVIAAEPQLDPAEPQASVQPEIPIQTKETDSAPGPAPVSDIAPVPGSSAALQTASVPSSAPAMILLPADPLPLPPQAASEEAPNGKRAEFLIEDLGPDENEDKPVPQEKLVIDQDVVEVSSADVGQQNNAFGDPALTPSIGPPTVPPQHDYLPGNLL